MPETSVIPIIFETVRTFYCVLYAIGGVLKPNAIYTLGRSENRLVYTSLAMASVG